MEGAVCTGSTIFIAVSKTKSNSNFIIYGIYLKFVGNRGILADMLFLAIEYENKSIDFAFGLWRLIHHW